MDEGNQEPEYQFTAKQQEILTQVHQELSEHFENYVVIVSTEPSDDHKGELVDVRFGGGWSAAIGLCKVAIKKVMEL